MAWWTTFRGGYGTRWWRKQATKRSLRAEDRRLTDVTECDECPWTPSQHCCLRYQIEEDSDG